MPCDLRRGRRIVLARAGPGGRRPGWADRVRAAGEAGLARGNSKRPVPKNGCYHAAYPDTEWREVQCGRPSPVPNQPRKGGGANIVGNGADYAAKTSGLISSVTGSFLEFLQARPAKAGTWPLRRSRPTRQLQPTTSLRCRSIRKPISSRTGARFPLRLATDTPDALAGSSSSTLNPGARADRNAGIGGAWRQPPAFLPYGPCYRSMHPGRRKHPWRLRRVLAVQLRSELSSPALLGRNARGTLWNNDGTGNCWFNGPISYIEPLTAADFAPAASGGLVMTASVTASQDKLVLATSSSMALYQEPSALACRRSGPTPNSTFSATVAELRPIL